MHIAGRVFDALFKDRRNTEIAEKIFGLNSGERERRRQLVRLSPQFWLNLQSQYDLRLAEAEAGKEVRKLPTRAS